MGVPKSSKSSEYFSIETHVDLGYPHRKHPNGSLLSLGDWTLSWLFMRLQVIFLQSNMAKENPPFIDDFHIQTPLKLGFSIAISLIFWRVHQNSMVNCHRYPPFSDPYHILHHTSHDIRVAVPRKSP